MFLKLILLNLCLCFLVCVCLCVHAREREILTDALLPRTDLDHNVEIQLYIILKPHIQIMNGVHCKCIYDTGSSFTNTYRDLCSKFTHIQGFVFKIHTQSPTHLFMHWLRQVMMRCKVISHHKEKCSMRGQK